MNTKQLYKALTCNKYTNSYFNGIYSLDTLEDIEIKPKLIICNTDPSTKPGKHWVLFFFTKNNVEFFDSLGKGIETYSIEFLRFASRFAKTITQTSIRVQPVDTSFCGHYCLYFAYYRCRGKTMREIVNKMKNVRNINKEIKRLFSICRDSKCNFLQNCISC